MRGRAIRLDVYEITLPTLPRAASANSLARAAAAASEGWRRVDPDDAHILLGRIAVGVRPLRPEVERIARLQPVRLAADRQLQLAFHDIAELLARVRTRAEAGAAGMQRDQEGLHQVRAAERHEVLGRRL